MSTRPKRRPRALRVPMMAVTWQTIATEMHVAMAALRMSPEPRYQSTVASNLNMIALAMQPHPRLAEHAERVAGGARTLNQIADKLLAIAEGQPLKLHEHELRPIELAVSAAEDAVPHLSLTDLIAARLTLRQINARERAEREVAHG